MRTNVALLICSFLLSITYADAQEQRTAQTLTVEPFSLAITWNKTTNLVFPYAIKGVDRGSRDVLAQQAKGTENVLQLKAGNPNFQETNLTVITSDGKLYSCTVSYADSPVAQSYVFHPALAATVLFSTDSFNEEEVHKTLAAANEDGSKLHGLKDKASGMKLQLQSIFIYDGLMYFKLVIQNSSNIRYDIEQLRFLIKDQKRSKRTASQELVLEPVYTLDDTSVIPPNTTCVPLFVLQKFTIPDKKELIIQLHEKGGGRHLQLRVRNKSIMKARPV